jgi:hypothetical protein
VDEGVDQRDHARHGHHRADDVESARVPLALVQVEHCPEDEQCAYRHVHEEDPPPGRVLGQNAAEQQAERSTGAGNRGVHSECAVALLALGK